MDYAIRTAEAIKKEILREQVRLAMHQIPTTLAAAFIVALVLCFAVRDVVPLVNMAAWVLMILSITIGRITFYFRFSKVRETSFDGDYWSRIYLVLVLISGIFWGLSAFIIFPRGHAALIALFVLVIASLSATTTISHSSIKFGPTLWTMPAMLLYAIRCVGEGKEFGYTIGFLIILYLVTVLHYSFKHHRSITAAIATRFENLNLLKDIQRANTSLQLEIAERTQAETRLRLNEANLEVILQSTADGILAVDENGKIIKTNQNFAKLWRIPQAILETGDDDALLNFVLNQLSDPAAFLKKVKLLYGTADLDLDVLSFKDGRVFERFSAPLPRGSAIIGRVWSFRDITERARMQEELQQKEEQYRSLFLISTNAILIRNRRDVITMVNDAAIALFGARTADDLIGKLYLDLVHPEDRTLSSERVEKIFRLAEVNPNTRLSECKLLPPRRHRMVKLDGTVIYVESTGVAFRLRAEFFIQGIFRDVTENVQAEEALKRSAAEARRLSRENEAIARIGKIIGSSLDIGEVYEQFAWEAGMLVTFNGIAINLINHEQGTVTVPYSAGFAVPGCEPGDVFPLSTSVTGIVAQSRAGVIIQADDKDYVLRNHPTLAAAFDGGLRSVMAVPLIYQDQVIGAINLRSTTPRAYGEDDLRIADSIAAQVAGAVANAQLFGTLKKAKESLSESKQQLETAVKELGTSAEALRISETRYRRVSEYTGQLVYDWDIASGAIAWAGKIKEITGYSAEEFNSHGMSGWEQRIHPDDRGAVAQLLRNAMENHDSFRCEYRFQHADGNYINVEDHGAFEFDPAGRAVRMLGVMEDISLQKRADQETQKLEAQLRQAQKMEAIGTLAGGIAHDFNNLLAVIIGNAEIMKLADDCQPAQAEGLNQILGASQRAKQLVHQILAFSRRSEHQKVVVNLKPIVKESLDFLRASLPTTISLKSNVEPDVGTIIADPTQMQQVLMNLCTNAWHAMEQTGGVLGIELANKVVTEEEARLTKGARAGVYVRLGISDTGHGIEADVMEKIFDPYFTTKPKGKGTGLGLSVVDGIVKSLGGMIHVHSKPGRGTTFQVFLPRVDEAEKSEERSAQPLPRGSERILFVDDETALVDMGRRMLGLMGYQVETRTSPVEALEAFRANSKKFDLIITDMTMPQLTGLELAKRLIEIRPDIPIILCTGFSDLASERMARALGIREFLFKPLIMKDIAETIRKVLDKR